MGTLTPEGFLRLTQKELRDAIFAAWRSNEVLGQNFLDSPDSPQTAIAESVAEALASVEELLAASFAIASRRDSVGQQLDNLGDIIGVPRVTATASVVQATVNLNAGVTLPALSQAASVTDEAAVYQTLAAVTNDSDSPADFVVPFAALQTGPGTFVAAGDFTEIVTPVTGWNSVTNDADATLGTRRQTDAEYRLAQQASLAVIGKGTYDAILSALRTVPGVLSAALLGEGGEPVTPSYSGPLEAVVIGGADNSVAQALWDNVSAGVGQFGTTSGTATDIDGASRTIEFSRPDEVELWVEVTVVTNADYPGDAAFRSAFVQTAESTFGLGQTVAFTRLYDIAYSVPGVEDVALLLLSSSDPAAGTSNITLTARQIATWDTTRVLVNS